MEYFDVVDEHGNRTGQIAPRVKVHAEGLWHKTVHVWIMNRKGELLLQKRAPEKETHPNEWDISVGGHIAAGAKSVETAIREVKEELGIEIMANELQWLYIHQHYGTKRPGPIIDNEFSDVFLLEKEIDSAKMTLQPREVSAVKYMPYLDLKKKIAERNKAYVLHDKEYPKLFMILEEKFRGK